MPLFAGRHASHRMFTFMHIDRSQLDATFTHTAKLLDMLAAADSLNRDISHTNQAKRLDVWEAVP